MAKKIRFLIPFTLGQMEEARGVMINDHIMKLLEIFQGGYDQMIHSIIPILTKVKPYEPEFDLNHKKVTLLEIL